MEVQYVKLNENKISFECGRQDVTIKFKNELEAEKVFNDERFYREVKLSNSFFLLKDLIRFINVEFELECKEYIYNGML